MQFIEWKDTYNIGVKEIDIQHRGLFDIINKLSTTDLFDPNGKYFFLTLSKLKEYASVHFLTEERYMKEAGYGKFIEHKQEHSKFLESLSEFLTELENKQPETEKRILDYIKEWYSTHILVTDRDYLASLKAMGFR